MKTLFAFTALDCTVALGRALRLPRSWGSSTAERRVRRRLARRASPAFVWRDSALIPLLSSPPHSLSGLSAAHELLDRGANVLMLDKNAFFGGNSTKATSGINGAGTNSQGDLDIKDTSKTFYEDTLKSAADNGE